MNCPRCGKRTTVNRTVDVSWAVERNRRCPLCGAYFDTIEIPKKEYERYEKLVPSPE